MKKLIYIIISICLLTMGVITVPVHAAGSVSVRLSVKPSTARPGDIITVSVNMYGVPGAGGVASGGVKATYDTSKLTYQSAAIGKGKPAADLDVSVAGGTVNMVYLDNKGGSNGFSSDGTMATIKFKVKSVPLGQTDFKASVDGFGNKNASAINASASGCSLAIAAPFSSNNDLVSLTVANAEISPVFNKAVTNYTAEVPFSISKLDVRATAADSKAKVHINSPVLTPNGTTNMLITVTAENGSKKIYTIRVKRAQDPNYLPSSNNNLKSITVDGFILSPKFDMSRTDYVVWLPYEITEIKVSGKPVDSRAKVSVEGGKDLQPGRGNLVKIICSAENSEKKVYTVIAHRAVPHGSASLTEETEPKATNTTTTTNTTNGTQPLWLIILPALFALVMGAAGGIIGYRLWLKKAVK